MRRGNGSANFALKIIATAVLFVFLMLWSTLSAYSANIIRIDDECVRMDHIFPTLGIDDKIYCGLNYGEERKISVQMSKHLINRYGINARPGEAVFVRNGEPVMEEDVKDRLIGKLSAEFPDAELEIEKIRLPRNLSTAPGGDFTMELNNPRVGTVHGYIDNGFRKISFSAYVKGYVKALVTTDRVRKGETLKESVEYELVDMSRVRGDLVYEPTGLVADRNIGEGRTITKDMLKNKPDLAQGSSVRLVYESGTLRIETKGTLMDDAIEGKLVKVRNIESGRIVTAEFMGGRIAKANF
ncbi:flagellar basal body P-ring formation chaperone FlgA [Limisalsivibrio acetivorans]|uniref:flagellar basal body P-ring formation chaperone FlgA n=1 Tax=Limisalsivibrio acetivorans TaxID=1304888 RepID=UPI0003B305F3|nr:flagellar basal body P-ring formation chaperone FlgA [Limisalsivibrio acetivorans]